jgi:hypothetical protein
MGKIFIRAALWSIATIIMVLTIWFLITMGHKQPPKYVGQIVGFTNGSEIISGLRTMQFESTNHLDTVFINGVLANRIGDLYMADVPIKYDRSPIIISTINSNGVVEILQELILKGDKGTESHSTNDNAAIQLTSPPDGIIINTY